MIVLKFVRIYDFKYIPEYLWEQVDGNNINPESISMIGDIVAKDPLTLLYLLVDNNNVTKGYFWASINVLTKTLFIKHLSLDKEYQNGSVIPRVIKFLKDIINNTHLKKKMVCATTRPRAFEKYGGKRSESVNMELEWE